MNNTICPEFNPMNTLHIYAIFHANLKFSSVPSDHYSLILDRCYWPILELASQQDIKVGLEFSAFTLETVYEIDPTFVRAFKRCWNEGKCDLIGSGYIQSALPTMPAEVNRKNLEFGNACYRRLMGQAPKIAYLNEQLYSSGLIKLYKDAGYEAIVMDWDNSAAYNGFPEEDIYRPQYVKGTKDHTLRLLWNSSISFQKFQQCVFGEFPVEEYIDFVKSHYSENNDRSYPIYGSDLEIFDYKPHHSDPHHFAPLQEEMDRIREIFLRLKSLEDVELLTPSEILRRFHSEKIIKIETSEYPLPCKKQ
ncbi:MAG: alpha-amylase, partial [Deltaproteobacteria bacterium]|nr:alpha-amylase [Deltaproteobacteria bacterium]